MRADIAERARRVRLVMLDVDGVMTDAGMYYSPEGELLKKFNTRDGMGVQRLREAGIVVAIVTGENSPIVSRRAEKLKIEEVHLGVSRKVEVLRDLCARYELEPDEVAFIGDDVNDLPALRLVGLAASVADGMPAVRAEVHVVTACRGGEGAVREFAELILGVREAAVAPAAVAVP